jgi:cellulose synthase/poly-beta-1,6-N-acetylglucosamine synthase-like glycosyltransferase/peptidoglycan/xylan/chitin deacetylase (PgdA/CDA1 family)/spore germination protein YaaH
LSQRKQYKQRISSSLTAISVAHTINRNGAPFSLISMAKPIFLDTGRKRWKRVRAISDVAGAIVTVVLVVFLFSVVFHNPELPGFLLPEPRHPYRAFREREKANRPFLSKRHQKHKGAKAIANAPVGVNGEGPRAAFYVQWDAGSLASLKEYYGQVDLLFPEWLHVITPDGKVQVMNEEKGMMFDLVQNGEVHQPDEKVMAILRDARASTQVLPLVNNFTGGEFGEFTSEPIGKFLMDVDSRRYFLQQIDQLLSSGEKYAGIAVDFEEIPLSAQPGFRALIHDMYAQMHPKGQKLYVNVPVDDKDYDYVYLAQNVDGLVLMDYDEHQVTSQPGPVASQEFFLKNLRDILKIVPRKKIMMAIANYGYEWPTKKVHGKQTIAGRVVTQSVQEAWIRARESEASVELDQDSLNPHIAYFEEDDNTRRDIWFTDAVSALNQMRGANQLGIDSFALWRLGSEDRSLWTVWDAPSEEGAAKRLQRVPPGQDVDFEGSGEVLRIVERPRDGNRVVGIDGETGLITSETMTQLPIPYQVERYGAKPGKIALSFDDGPDPKFTPQILDILKQKDVKAAFFLIGSQGERYTSIMKRVYDEGHEIGNHTYTHPDISSLNGKYMDLELNLTERLFASVLGVKPLYFRPPYSVDEEPDTADQVRPLEQIQDRGYVTIGNKIDPSDWQDNPRRSAEEITGEVFRQLESRKEKKDPGFVILLHDGGGDRSETVRALPVLIDRLRAAGYEIVPVSALLDKTRADVMPAISPNERLTAFIDRFAFLLFNFLENGIVLIFFLGDILMTGRLAFVGVGAFIDRIIHHGRMDAIQHDFEPDVAVLVPAYNEETVIERTIRSVLHSTYKKLRVIVIDDGSKDRTFEVAQQAFAAEVQAGKVMVLHKPNAGKASAANFGLEQVTEEIFVAIDADTVIHPTAIAHMVPHFRDARVGAIAGNAKVGNRINIWTRWQALEYITSQNFERRALNVVNAVSVVPGAIGAWRTKAVKDVGMYPYDTVAEDADLTMSLLQAGYKVQYEDRALAYTEAPLTASGLMRQRFRWSFGILQSVFKHKGAFWRGGALGWIALPNILIFQILLPLVSPFIDLMFAFGTLAYLLDRHYHPDTANLRSFEKLVLFFVLFLVIDFIASVLAFALERREARAPEDKWLLTQVWLQRFAYRQLFSVVLFKTLKRAVDGKPFNWDKLERTASVTQRGMESKPAES